MSVTQAADLSEETRRWAAANEFLTATKGIKTNPGADAWEPPDDPSLEDLPNRPTELTWGAEDRPILPEDPEPGAYRCGTCRSCVTVNGDGDEFGHTKGWSADRERCPRRPDWLDENRPPGGEPTHG